MAADILIVVAARNEADRIADTLDALAAAFPGAPVWVADDGSIDTTAELAHAAGATVVHSGGGGWRVCSGKGQAMTAAAWAALANVDSADGNARVRARARVNDDLEDLSSGAEDVLSGVDVLSGAEDVLSGAEVSPEAPRAPGPTASDPTPGSLTGPPPDPIVVLCDGDLGDCARELAPLVEAIRRGEADLAVAAFSTRATGGFGIALAFARWVVHRCSGLRVRAPISGQRALRASVLREVLPLAPGYGMEVGMTIDAVRAGRRVLEIDLPLTHRPTGRTLAGFAHRGRQLVDFVWAYLHRR